MSNVPGWPPGFGRRIHAELDSTLDEAARIAAALSGPTWILAYNQTGGRGRRGRAWAMPAGNFASALILKPTEPPAVVALRSFVAALAVGDAIAAVTGRGDLVTLKWPNDVLLNGGKVSGILLESVGQGGTLSHLALGIGVNLAAAPPVGTVEPGALHPVSVLDETGVQVAPEEFLTALATTYARWEDRFRREGFAPVREAWLGRAARIGERIVARTGRTETAGIFETIDGDGALILATGMGRRAIPAAEIFF